MIVLRTDDPLDLETYWRIVDGHEPIELDAAAVAHVAERRQAFERYLATGGLAYGVTTGLGKMSRIAVPAADQPGLQRAILVGRAAGVGPPHDEATVRGTMLLRLAGFLTGHAGVTPDLCAVLAALLNSGWYPVVPASRPGTAGETIPLCHLFQTLIGEGEVIVGGDRVDAASALAARGHEPYELSLKEGLALVNGAPLAGAMAAGALRRGDRLLDDATVVGTLSATLMGASWRPYSRRLAELADDPGQQAIASRIAELGADTGAATDADLFEDRPQAPVSLRVLPQVHGAAHDTLATLRRTVEHALRGVTDSPLFLDAADDEPAGMYPSGGFHSQALSIALDATAIALTQVAALAEKRLHRLLDARYSGLAEQLAVDAATGGSGLVSLHKAVVGLCAENRLLANPASVHAGDTSSGQEDVQAFTGLAADKLDRLADNLELVLAYELVADRQADALAVRPLPLRLHDVAERLAAALPVVTSDRSLAPLVEIARSILREGPLSDPRTAAPRARCD